MGNFGPRTLQNEVEKHFRWTHEERILVSLRLGDELIDLFTAAHPGTSREQSREILARNKNRGRAPSAVAQT